MKSLFAGFILLLSLPLQAQVYKCIENGQTVYSQTPCATDAQPLELRPLAVEPGVSAQPGQDASAVDARQRRIEESNQAVKRRILDDRIRRKELELDASEKEMKDKLAELQRKKEGSGNRPANAAWVQSIAEEMRATIDGYNVRFDRLRREIDGLKNEKDSIGS